MEDWMRRRIVAFRNEKERNIVKLSGMAIQAIRRGSPSAALLKTAMWVQIVLLVGVVQFEEWYNEE